MNATAQAIDNLSLNVTQEIHVGASLDATFTALLEEYGPLFMSCPAVSNLQYRLSEADGGTLIKFRHTALGLFPDELRKNVSMGWSSMNERIRTQAAGK